MAGEEKAQFQLESELIRRKIEEERLKKELKQRIKKLEALLELELASVQCEIRRNRVGKIF